MVPAREAKSRPSQQSSTPTQPPPPGVCPTASRFRSSDSPRKFPIFLGPEYAPRAANRWGQVMSSGTRVNWRKGFFRVWVLGAVLWIPLSALAVADDLARANRRETETRSASGLFDDVPMAQTGSATGTGMFDHLIPGSPTYVPPRSSTPTDLNEISPTAAGASPQLDASDYSRVAAVAFLPPLVVLIAGFALGWVYRGFRAF